MTKWDRFFESKLKLIAQSDLVLDVGGGNPFQKDLKPYAKLFNKTTYLTVDINTVYQPSLVGDIHQLPFKNSSVDAIICKAVLEHVKNPFLAVEEMFRIAKPRARLLVYTPFIHPYHGSPYYKDYYRYSHDGLMELFKAWRNIRIQPVRGYFETLTNFLPNPFPDLTQPIASRLDSIKSTPQVSGHFLYAVK